MSVLSRELSADDKWQDLVSWDSLDEIYDPLFQGSSANSTSQQRGEHLPDYRLPVNATAELDFPSAPPSVSDDLLSLDYTLSGPPSVIDGPPSLNRAYSWLSASPSYSTTATSPIISRQDGPLNGSDNVFDQRPFSQRIGTESPVIDAGEQILTHSFESNESFASVSPHVFNPYLPGTSYAFNSLDLSSSQALSNFGGWADQSFAIEPIPELDHEQAIPIPHQNQIYSNGLSSFSPTTEQSLSNAIEIPQSNRREPAFYNSQNPSPWARHVPPILSDSPEARRRSRSNTLSRSLSRSEPRRIRNSQMLPSPTSNALGWVSYQPHQETNRLVASATEGGGRRQRGRTKALTLDQRKNAALMRVIKACSNCKKRKEKCDPGTPCRSCLDHYKGDLVNSPCRDRLLSNLSEAFLSERLGWHPTSRSLESFAAPFGYKVLSSITYNIPIHLGFGPVLTVPVHALQMQRPGTLYHDHIIYSWPPSELKGGVHTHAVLPAVLSPEGQSTLRDTLDKHLSLIVAQHFRSFPLYCSPLRILREVYIFYRTLNNSEHANTLQKALKLLVIVHIGGDLTLPAPSSNDALAQLVQASLPFENVLNTDVVPTPCFIRSQLGSVLPGLAHDLMKDVLTSLERLFLARESQEWPIALAVLIVVLMTIESIHYHDAKLPYHHLYDSMPSPTQHYKAEARKVDDQNVETLLSFYSACFPTSHTRLRSDGEGDVGENRFIEAVREAIRSANAGGGYLEKRATEERTGEDMGYFFDRLVARLLVLKS
ncbi:hypothetical protein B0J11DRAFT_548064 [Dendryphion nanum]|uniref:Zn(2)-C6 fungal-type domain-containing protein n=1 Tax=Dendryphion nanum TaxID=256645 RepID=A0A9P9ITQ5_9PLEO|nr:hypothetical protein B0J11DRAFT_548064 [Dendryphion nanum]